MGGGRELDFRLSHVGLLTDRVDQVAGFYTRCLGMTAEAPERECPSVSLRDGTRGGFRIQVHGPPWRDEIERGVFEGRGACLDGLHFSVEDVSAAYDYLHASGCVPRLPPTSISRSWKAALYDPQGIEVWLHDRERDGELVRPPRPLAEAGAERTSEPVSELHHVGILTPDRQTAVDFYTRVMGLEIRRRFYSPGVVDVTFLTDKAGCATFLQIEGPPHLTYEERYLAERGPGLNHLHFMVDDLQAAQRRLIANGAWENIVPYTLDGVAAALVFDPFGIDLQVTDSPPASLLL